MRARQFDEIGGRPQIDQLLRVFPCGAHVRLRESTRPVAGGATVMFVVSWSAFSAAVSPAVTSSKKVAVGAGDVTHSPSRALTAAAVSSTSERRTGRA